MEESLARSLKATPLYPSVGRTTVHLINVMSTRATGLWQQYHGFIDVLGVVQHNVVSRWTTRVGQGRLILGVAPFYLFCSTTCNVEIP